MPDTQVCNYPTLGQLLTGFDLGEFSEFAVGPLRLDSRKIHPGETFVALQGTHQKGADYVGSAVEHGAALVLIDGKEFGLSHFGRVPLVTVPGLRQQLSVLAAQWFGRPSSAMSVVGITGTNGKTTCCQWLAQLVDGMPQAAAMKVHKVDAGTSGSSSVSPLSMVKAATVGTLGYGLVNEALIDTGLTTPDAVDFQALLSSLLSAKANTIVAEVSSHSLDQGRVAAVEFDVAVFTNIGHDHLDYHGSLVRYVEAKAALMKFSSLRAAVINLDDDYAPQFICEVAQNVRVITYGVEQRSADFSVENVVYKPAGTKAVLSSPEGKYNLDLSVWGEFNLCNVLAVIASGYALGFSVDSLVNRLGAIKPVPGRLEPVTVDTDITVLIDFAHTADALRSVLSAVRHHINGNIWCVFGCGGDRDISKRPLMAKIAQTLADYVVVTSDNPRSENPANIIDGIMSGFQQPSAVHRIEDRETAIRFAIEQAAPGDCVLLAGKGHEEYQLIGSQRLPFNDAAVARLALQVRPATIISSGGRDD